jgi:hypothetical protein
VESRLLEANTNPALDSEGYFLYGPNGWQLHRAPFFLTEHSRE